MPQRVSDDGFTRLMQRILIGALVVSLGVICISGAVAFARWVL